MKIYPIINEEGGLHAFEISNLFVGRRKAVGIVKKLRCAKIIRSPKLLLSWFREESFCEFSINNIFFEIEEPFGDNSRYLISCKSSPAASTELNLVAEAFSCA